jgi:hypothetical protein
MATKNFLTSKTIWGVVTMVAAQFFPGAVDVTQMPSDGLGWAKVVISLAGAALAVYGRWNANQKLTTGASTPVNMQIGPPPTTKDIQAENSKYKVT